MSPTYENLAFLSALAGGVGAFGNQLLYWRNVLRVQNREVNRWMIPISLIYVITGALIGFIINLDYPGEYLFCLGGGAAWPTLLKSMDDVRQFAVAFRRKLGIAEGGD